MAYTEEQKAEAVRLYLEVGAGDAAETIGCSRRQIYRWLGSHNVTPKTNDDRRATTEARHTAKREELRDLLLDQALDMLHRMNEMHVEYIEIDGKPAQVAHLKAGAGDSKNYATAAAILIDKYRLERGESTGRTEILSPIDMEMERIVAEHKRQSAGSPS